MKKEIKPYENKNIYDYQLLLEEFYYQIYIIKKQILGF